MLCVGGVGVVECECECVCVCVWVSDIRNTLVLYTV